MQGLWVSAGNSCTGSLYFASDNHKFCLFFSLLFHLLSPDTTLHLHTHTQAHTSAQTTDTYSHTCRLPQTRQITQTSAGTPVHTQGKHTHIRVYLHMRPTNDSHIPMCRHSHSQVDRHATTVRTHTLNAVLILLLFHPGISFFSFPFP